LDADPKEGFQLPEGEKAFENTFKDQANRLILVKTAKKKFKDLDEQSKKDIKAKAKTEISLWTAFPDKTTDKKAYSAKIAVLYLYTALEKGIPDPNMDDIKTVYEELKAAEANEKKEMILKFGISKFGIDNFLILLFFGLLFVIICIFTFTWSSILSIIYFMCGLLFWAGAFWFFRDPERSIPKYALKNPAVILSPADGKVVEIVEEYENNYMHTKAKRISIFLSILDVHVNRVPASGVIEYVKFIPGRKLIASNSVVSKENQQSIFGLKNPNGKIVFKQIVGVVARRIVWNIQEGDTVVVGQKFGMIKFGSRMDIFLPIETNIKVQVGQKVVAGQSQLAELKHKK